MNIHPITWLNTQIEWLKGFVSKDGKASGTSLMKFSVIYVFCRAYIKATYENSGSIPTIGWETILLLAAIIGLTPITQIASKFLDIKKGKINGDSAQ